jgi:hypothetical protein
MIAKLLAVFAVILAFRGSYLQKKATNKEEQEYSLMVSMAALLLTVTAFILR